MDKPLVSICSITYNQAPYIRECLDSFIMQKTDFPFEIIINDDCSTDGTTEIIMEYAEKYPDLIHPIFHDENQYQKGVRGMFLRFVFPKARGKYIALCEGDDYWTDPLKLQKQVDILENNPHLSICATDCISLNMTTGTKKYYTHTNQDVITLNDLLNKGNLISTLTVMFRVHQITEFSQIHIKQNWVMGDYSLWLWLASKGDIYKLSEATAVYRILPNSVSHSSNLYKRFTFGLEGYNIRIYFAELFNKSSFYIKISKSFYCLKFFVKHPLTTIKNNI